MHTMEGIRMHVMIISFSLWQYDLVCDRIKLRIMTYKTFNIRIQENWTPQRVLASYSENFGNVVPRIMILDTFIMPPPPQPVIVEHTGDSLTKDNDLSVLVHSIHIAWKLYRLANPSMFTDVLSEKTLLAFKFPYLCRY